MNQYALYLRKSRADLDAESHGEGETLAKHRAALTELANRRGLFIAREYAEIISGDSIAARPQMQKLLEDVKSGMYSGVIVNDVDRLGRGDSIDQQIIKTTFAMSHCLIITPNRDIDLENPTDDDMMDFSMFMARFEYKKTSQRMQQGRRRSVEAGSYISAVKPYGYRVVKDGRYNHLEIDESEAATVRMIFDMFVNQNMSQRGISNTLNDMGYRTRNGLNYTYSRIHAMLANRVYIGEIRWGRHKIIKVVEPDGVRKKRCINTNENVLIIPNAHEPIISRDIFDAAQMKLQTCSPKIKERHTISNPLAGLLRCSRCGKMMIAYCPNVYNPTRRQTVRCVTRHCMTCSSPQNKVIDAIMETLKSWCAEYADTPPEPRPSLDKDLKRQLTLIDTQLARAHDLVEQGVYTVQEYLTRRDTLNDQRAAIQTQLDEYQTPKETAIVELLPQIKTVLESYPLATTAAERNRLLKSVISKIIYTRDAIPDHVTLDIYPRIKAKI